MPETTRPKLKMSTQFKLITILAVIIILVLSFLLILKPKYDRIIETRQELKTKQKEFSDQKIYFDEIKKLIANYQKLDPSDIEKIAKVLPTEQDIAGLFVQMEAMTNESGLNLTGLDISEKTVPELEKLQIKELDVALNLSGGDYEAFKKFLSIIESNLRLMDIISINFAPEATTYALNLKTYYKP